MDKQVRPLVFKLEEQMKSNREQFINYKDESLAKFRSVDSDLLRNRTFQEVTKNQLEKVNTEI